MRTVRSLKLADTRLALTKQQLHEMKYARGRERILIASNLAWIKKFEQMEQRLCNMATVMKMAGKEPPAWAYRGEAADEQVSTRPANEGGAADRDVPLS